MGGQGRENLRNGCSNAKGDLWGYLWEAITIEDPQPDRMADLGQLSISRAEGQEEGLGAKVPGEEWGQPETCQAAQFLTTKIFKEPSCCLTSAAQTSQEFLFWSILLLSVRGKEFWVI